MKKIGLIAIIISLLISTPVSAAQFNRYEADKTSDLNKINSGNAQLIELLVDFSSSMSDTVEVTKKTLVYILPKLDKKKVALRLFGGKYDSLSEQNSQQESTEYDKCMEKLKKIDCDANPVNDRECRKIKASCQALNKNVNQRPSASYIGVCSATKLVASFAVNNSSAIISGFDKGSVYGNTPMELGLREAVNDLGQWSSKRKKKIILITDGYETCGGDPCAYIKNLVKTNRRITIDVIIVGSNDNLRCLSDATGGKYYKVDKNTLIDALEKTFEVPKGTADKVRKYKYVDFDKLDKQQKSL